MSRSLFLPAASLIASTSPWAKAVAVVVGLHMGAAGIVTARALVMPVDDAISGAEMVIEFAPVVTSAESEFAPEAQNHDADDKQATPHLDEALSRKREVDLPTEQTSPTTPVEEDLRMAQEKTQKESETQTELQTTEAMTEQKQEVSSQASVAAESSPEQTGTPVADASAAPEEGSSAEAKRKIEAWQRKLFVHIVRHKRYPDQARSQRLTGETLISFRLDRQGQVSALKVARSSGSSLLDGAALAVLERASPLPAPPAQLTDQSLDFSIPMRFAAK